MADFVLLPGMDGSGELSAEFVSALGMSAHSIVVTYPPDQPLGYGELETFVHGQLPTDRPYILIAESFSGPIAISLAARQPAGLAALVLACTFVRFPMPIPGAIARLALHAPLGPLSAAIAARYVLGRFSTKQTRAQIQQAVSKLRPEIIRERLRSIIDVDVADHLRQVSIPVLCLRAAHDRLIPRSSSIEIQNLCPQARVMEIDGPHFLLLCKSSECANAVRKFVTGQALSI